MRREGLQLGFTTDPFKELRDVKELGRQLCPFILHCLIPQFLKYQELRDCAAEVVSLAPQLLNS